MAKVSINPEKASEMFFAVVDVLKALRRFDGVLEAPVSEDEEGDEDCYSIEDCLTDLKKFVQELDEEVNAGVKE